VGKVQSISLLYAYVDFGTEMKEVGRDEITWATEDQVREAEQTPNPRV
jgi:hypothetical protein